MQASGTRGAVAFASLPHAVALAIFSRVPVETRLRCREVCRAWRDALADATAWLRLDFETLGGKLPTEGVLRAAVLRAGGRLEALLLRHPKYTVYSQNRIKCTTLVDILAANANTMRELYVNEHVDGGSGNVINAREIAQLLRAAPLLQVLDAHVDCTAEEALHVLRNEPPFGPLRLRALIVDDRSAIDIAAALMSVAAALANVQLHPSLTDLAVCNARFDDFPDVLDAMVDVVLSRRLCSFRILKSSVSGSHAPALARLLSCSTLSKFGICGQYRLEGTDLLFTDEAGQGQEAALIADALRSNRTLTKLTLTGVGLWSGDLAAAATLLLSLLAHPTLRTLILDFNRVGENGAFAGSVLAALVMANGGALERLYLYNCQLGEDALAPLLRALPHTQRLRELDIRGAEMSAEFASEQLLPAVRANTSLRSLCLRDKKKVESAAALPEAALEAVRLVKERPKRNAA